MSHWFPAFLVAVSLVVACGTSEQVPYPTEVPDVPVEKIDTDGSDPETEVTEADLPCIDVFPDVLTFGGKIPPGPYSLPVEVHNCGTTAALLIVGIGFTGGSEGCAGPFCVVAPAEWGAGVPSAASPLVLAPNERAVFEITYSPVGETALDPETGEPIQDEATLVVASDAFVSETEVPVSGFGAADTCPVAVIAIDEGEEVIPQTVLHLHGEGSYSAAGAITKYKWSVEQPVGSTSKLVPTDSYPTPSFEANVAGKYVFRLEVWDEHGRHSCQPAEATVYAVPDEAIHVELVWTSPGDPDPLDEGPDVGTNLDLHFAHPNASQYDLDGDGKKDPWFDTIWDTFWFYPEQPWGSGTHADEKPSLDRDDVDGNGPENINLDVPEEGKTYRFGVNYWDDHGYGTAFATVRVYIYAQMVFDVKDVPLIKHDMWWVGSIDWPSGQVKAKTTAQGEYFITHDYHHPLFYEP